MLYALVILSPTGVETKNKRFEVVLKKMVILALEPRTRALLALRSID